MITSTANDKVRRIISFQKKPKERRKEDVFLVEGIKMVLEAPRESVKEIYVSESFLEKQKAAIPEAMMRCLAEGKSGYEIVSDKVFAAMSDTQSPQGILAVLRAQHYEMKDLFGKGAPLIMVLENIQDPGNLGTILRTSEGAGVSGILMTSGTADVYNPKVIRSTMGSIFRQPFVYTEDLHGDIQRLKAEGIRVFAAHLKGTAQYDEASYTGGTAFLIGNESKGLTDETASLADQYIRIPMLGKVESLNAAVASSILMYEAARQRRR